MAFEFIQIPANGQGSAKEELNKLLRGGRIASVKKEFVSNGEDSFWAFCIEFLDGTLGVMDKGRKQEVRRFAENLDENLDRLRQELMDRSFQTGKFNIFKVFDPKERTIHAARFPERVFHHALMNLCEPVLERQAVFHSYACRKGKGRLKAIDAAQKAARGHAWHLKLDIRKYFESIPQERLIARLQRLFKDPEVLHWLEQIIRGHRPEEGKGLPIGSLTSQHLANFYLGPLDRFCQGHPAVKAYCRYMDDFVCWGDDKAAVIALGKEIQSFVENELGLTLKHPPCPQRTARGMDFLGYRLFPSHAELNRRSKVRYWRRLRLLNALHEGCLISARALQERLTALTAFVLPVRSHGFRRGVMEKFRSAENESDFNEEDSCRAFSRLSQRDCVSKPRVARNSLPWGVVTPEAANPIGVVSGVEARHTESSPAARDATPLGLMGNAGCFPRVGPVGPTPGFETQSLWDWKKRIRSAAIGHEPGEPGRQLEQQREQLPYGEPQQQHPDEHEQQHRVPHCPQLRPTVPERITMSMGLNRPPSRSHPASGCDKMTKRPPGAGRPVDAGSKAPGGIFILLNAAAGRNPVGVAWCGAPMTQGSTAPRRNPGLWDAIPLGLAVSKKSFPLSARRLGGCFLPSFSKTARHPVSER